MNFKFCKKKEKDMKRYLVHSSIFYKERFFCSVEREIWAETGNEAKEIFKADNTGDGFTCKHVVVKELK